METSEQLSLSWDAHQKSICSGLSLLQQRSEFVDMTLAAEGHYVKVHKMVLSLVSPYIKELILATQCPHPVIFLNNITYSILCAILEYIYTGEVHVAKDKLSDLIAAGKALHIRGLREMDVEPPTDPTVASVSCTPMKNNVTDILKDLREKKAAEPVPLCKIYLDDTIDISEDSTADIREESMDESRYTTRSDSNEIFNTSNDERLVAETSDNYRKNMSKPKLQYSVSNQGGLQVICNRYIYHLRYCGKKNSKRSWRCIDYNKLKCAAYICTDENNQVTKRSHIIHNHPFHDNKIIKKLRLGAIYSVFQDAQERFRQK